jgi:putative acetyltransferase
MIVFRREASGDGPAIRRVNEAAFGQADEADLVERLCSDGDALLSLVAVDDDDNEIVGHLLLSDLPIKSVSDLIRAAALAPVAVIPDHQDMGVGGGLIMQAIKDVKKLGVEALVVLGAPEYYERFGFSPALVDGLDTKLQGPSLMGLALRQGALDGVSGKPLYAPAFELNEE